MALHFRPKQLMKNLGEGLQHLFYPHNCAGCGSDLLATDALLCLHCLNSLPFTNFSALEENPVGKIFRGRLPLVSASSLLYFTKDSLLQTLLHQLKYKGKKELGIYFGRRMAETYSAISAAEVFDTVIPLPLHTAKEKKRGYNQAAKIAEGIGELLQIPVREDLVRRKEETVSQTNKNRQERWENMEGKFSLQEESALYGKHVLLVDDVVTTGATLEACGAALLKADGLRLSISTVAYTAR